MADLDHSHRARAVDPQVRPDRILADIDQIRRLEGLLEKQESTVQDTTGHKSNRMTALLGLFMRRS